MHFEDLICSVPLLFFLWFLPTKLKLDMEKEMEAALVHVETTQQHMNPHVLRRKGGFITMPFIIGMKKLKRNYGFGNAYS